MSYLNVLVSTWLFLSLFFSLISSDLTRMTDTERDQIDQDAQIFMRTCSDAIKQLRIEGKAPKYMILVCLSR